MSVNGCLQFSQSLLVCFPLNVAALQRRTAAKKATFLARLDNQLETVVSLHFFL